MDVPAGHVVQEVPRLLRQGAVVPLDEEDALVPERAGPVGVDLQLAPDILGDDQLLREVCNPDISTRSQARGVHLFL